MKQPEEYEKIIICPFSLSKFTPNLLQEFDISKYAVIVIGAYFEKSIKF